MAEKLNAQTSASKDVVANVLKLLAALSRQHSLEPLKQLFWLDMRSRDLLKTLGQIYFQHNMQDWMDNRSRRMEDDEVPRLICSEGLI